MGLGQHPEWPEARLHPCFASGKSASDRRDGRYTGKWGCRDDNRAVRAHPLWGEGLRGQGPQSSNRLSRERRVRGSNGDGTGASATPEDTVPAWAALGACALALVLPISQFLINTPISEHPAPGWAVGSHSPPWFARSPHPARPPQCHRGGRRARSWRRA